MQLFVGFLKPQELYLSLTSHTHLMLIYFSYLFDKYHEEE